MNCLVKLLFVCYFVPPLSSVSLSRALFLLHLSHLPTVFFFFAFFSPFRVLTILFSHRAPNLNFQLNSFEFLSLFVTLVLHIVYLFDSAHRIAFYFIIIIRPVSYGFLFNFCYSFITCTCLRSYT